VIVALAVFLMVKLVNKLRRDAAEAPEAAPAAPTATELLLTEIRDALKAPAAKAPAAKK
jgi:large conductance mechanosensitive channel